MPGPDRRTPGEMSAQDVLQLQAAIGNRAVSQLLAPRTAAQPTQGAGLPPQLKAGVESLSGLSMDDVRVHHGSAEPARLQAHAFTQGSEIHLGPGQEKHLPHEAWHVAQQKHGRVAVTTQFADRPGNDNPALEHEADVMGARALSAGVSARESPTADSGSSAQKQPVQRVKFSRQGLDKLAKQAEAEANIKAICRALNQACETVESTVLPRIIQIQARIESASATALRTVPPEIAKLFGDQHKLAGLRHMRAACELLVARKDQVVYLDSYAKREGKTACYAYGHNHDGQRTTVLGETNLGVGAGGVITFTSTMATASANKAFITIIHEHAHALGYNIVDLGYEYEVNMARLERLTPDLTPHNADSVAHGALALSGLKDATTDVNIAYEKRHSRLANELPAQDEKKAEKKPDKKAAPVATPMQNLAAYVLKEAMPFPLQAAWPKKEALAKKQKMDARYSLTGADWVKLAATVDIQIADVTTLKPADWQHVLYQITDRTAAVHKAVQRFSAAEVDAGQLALFQWIRGILTRGVTKDPEVSEEEESEESAEPVKFKPGKTIKTFSFGEKFSVTVSPDTVAAVKDLATDGGLSEAVVTEVVEAFSAKKSYTSKQELTAILVAKLPSNKERVAEEIVEYLAEMSA
ncbi:MAG TPA: DUF4157 domain-containing protein [Kofleriaceae bacterium]